MEPGNLCSLVQQSADRLQTRRKNMLYFLANTIKCVGFITAEFSNV